MLYIIDEKCYVNIAPSIYVEVVISKDGKITPTNKRLEANATTVVTPTTLTDWLKKYVQTEPHRIEREVDRKYRRKK